MQGEPNRAVGQARAPACSAQPPSRTARRRFGAMLMLAPWCLAPAARAAEPAPAPAPRHTVYHVQDSKEQATRMFLYVNNHLGSDPQMRITVIGHAGGVDFMLVDAVDKNDVEYEPALRELMKTGRVRFVACNLTLLSRQIARSALVPGVELVASGVAEIADMQIRLGAAYIRP